VAKLQNILETVGNTPVVRINRLAPPGVNLFVPATRATGTATPASSSPSNNCPTSDGTIKPVATSATAAKISTFSLPDYIQPFGVGSR
jgi:hypothetical protein